ncbi:methylamine utilization protein MauE [Virgisporangium aurantiacum]|uniref:Methylamine utilization protein MauE n=1 Tax=Virgisporangium aurantiacum TaxID=175570 RepID=A0A8J3ZDF4_9ACTN|nr:methylamine utilization protein MauE [Virgisporangium aurantiacum]
MFGRCLIGVVFLFSAWGKRPGAGRFRQFSDSLAAMRVLPTRFVRPVATVVVGAETAVVLLLLPQPLRPLAVAGFALAIVLLLGFAVSIGLVLRRGVQASCRCFGGSGAAPFRRHHIVRNLVLVTAAGAGLVAALAEPAITWEAVALGGGPAVVLALLTTRLDDVVELFAPAPPVPVRRR